MNKEKTLREYGLDLLNPYIEKINHKDTKSFTIEALSYVPERFFYIPASSSGKYHPSYALGTGGLIRHTAAALYFAEALFPLYHFTSRQKDYIRAALILHDTQKPSKAHLELLRDKYPEIFELVIALIECHMGEWDYLFPTPQSSAEKFTHLCDYLASRKEVSVDLFSRD